MDAAFDAADSLHEQANDLYWNSSDTVDQLAARLGMSRNALYGSVRPTAAGMPCTTCNEPLFFTNRSRRTAGKATCLACDLEVQLDTALPTATVTAVNNALGDAPPHEVPPPSSEGGGTLDQLRESLANVEPERAALIGGAAALGAAVGAAAIKVIRRK